MLASAVSVVHVHVVVTLIKNWDDLLHYNIAFCSIAIVIRVFLKILITHS